MKFKRYYLKFISVIVIIIAFLFSFYFYKYFKDSLDENLIGRVETISSTFSIYDKWQDFSFNETDLNKPSYLELKDMLIDARSKNKDIRFIYILTKINDELVFLVDSEDASSPDSSPSGQVYTEATQKFKDVFVHKKTIIEGPYTDRWGTWVSSSAFINNDFDLPLTLGMDMNATKYTTEPYIFASIPILFSLIVLIFIWVIVVLNKKEQKIMKMKSDFISIASHDLRTPLNGIRWSLENLLTSKSIPELPLLVTKKLKDMHIASITLLQLVNELLDIKLIEEDVKSLFKKGETNLFEVIKDSVDIQKLFASTRNIEIKNDFTSADIIVNGDRNRLYTVFNNIISNAVKYSKENGIILISGILQDDGKYVDIFVKDDGIGIKKDDLNKVKQGFFRAENAKAQTIVGSGYGIYITDMILKFYGGSINMESKENDGTKVIIRLLIKK